MNWSRCFAKPKSRWFWKTADCTRSGIPEKRILFLYDRSQYVYENKQGSDKIPAEKQNIGVNLTQTLQKIAGL